LVEEELGVHDVLRMQYRAALPELIAKLFEEGDWGVLGEELEELLAFWGGVRGWMAMIAALSLRLYWIVFGRVPVCCCPESSYFCYWMFATISAVVQVKSIAGCASGWCGADDRYSVG
jgi:hypothetical protein